MKSKDKCSGATDLNDKGPEGTPLLDNVEVESDISRVTPSLPDLNAGSPESTPLLLDNVEEESDIARITTSLDEIKVTNWPSPATGREYESKDDQSASNDSCASIKDRCNLSEAESSYDKDSHEDIIDNPVTVAVPERASTELHLACAASDVTAEDLRAMLARDPAAAAKKDLNGQLPLHIIAQNEALQSNLSENLDSFILNDLFKANPQGFSSQDDHGRVPFVASIYEWIERSHNIHTPTSLHAQPLSSQASLSKDPETPPDIIAKNIEDIIPEQVDATPIVCWSINMLSSLVDQDRRSPNEIVDAVASIPALLKTLLLIEDGPLRAMLFESSIIQHVLFCKKSIGPWLVQMIESKKCLAQEGGVLYLEIISSIQDETTNLLHGIQKGRTFRINSSNNIAALEARSTKKDLFTEIANLPGILTSMLHLKKGKFEQASTIDVVQYILDKELFHPQMLFIIVLDIIFLFLILIFFMLSTNKFFADKFFFWEGHEIINHTFSPNMTIYNLCKNGTIPNYTAYDRVCNYYYADTYYADEYGYDMDEEVCSFFEYYEGGLVNSSVSGDDLESNTYGEEQNETITNHTCAECKFCDQIESWNNDRWVMIVIGLSIICICAVYFFLRHLSAWFKIPRRLLMAKFGIWGLIDILSVCMALITQSLFMMEADELLYYNWFQTFWPLDSMQKIYDKVKRYDDFLRPLAAVTTGLLFMKVLGYFKMVNRYLATFVFALGEIAKDVFWFLWILLLLIVGFAHMFYTVQNRGGEHCKTDEHDQNYDNMFCTYKTSFLYAYTIILGYFEIDDFTTPFSVFLFVIYTFTVVIVVLNFLIAIIGDSYDKSMTRITKHFARARFMFVVESKAFLDIFSPSIDSSTEEESQEDIGCWAEFCRSLHNCSWARTWAKLCLLLMIIGGLATCIIILAFEVLDSFEMQLAVIIILPFVLLFALLIMAKRCGIISDITKWLSTFVVIGGIGTALTLVSLFFISNGSICLLMIIMLPLLTFLAIIYIGRTGGVQKTKLVKFLSHFVGQLLLFFFRLILGETFDMKATTKDTNEKEWKGRIDHIEHRLDQSIKESEIRMQSLIVEATQKSTQYTEKADHESESRLITSKEEIIAESASVKKYVVENREVVSEAREEIAEIRKNMEGMKEEVIKEMKEMKEKVMNELADSKQTLENEMKEMKEKVMNELAVSKQTLEKGMLEMKEMKEEVINELADSKQTSEKGMLKMKEMKEEVVNEVTEAMKEMIAAMKDLTEQVVKERRD